MAALPQVLTREDDAVQRLGTVTHLGADGWHAVRCANDSHGSTLRVRRAASCLLEPRLGDTVLVWGPNPAQAYIVAVIEQVDPAASRIGVDGDLTLVSRSGNVNVQAARDLTLTGTDVSLDGEMLKVNAPHARLALQDTEFLGVGVRATVASLRVVGRTCEVVMDRISHLAQHIFRLAERMEQARAGHIDYQADQTARVHARQTIVTGRDVVKVDADQIHMG